jgi:hypothetical protein
MQCALSLCIVVVVCKRLVLQWQQVEQQAEV